MELAYNVLDERPKPLHSELPIVFITFRKVTNLSEFPIQPMICCN